MSENDGVWFESVLSKNDSVLSENDGVWFESVLSENKAVSPKSPAFGLRLDAFSFESDT